MINTVIYSLIYTLVPIAADGAGNRLVIGDSTAGSVVSYSYVALL